MDYNWETAISSAERVKKPPHYVLQTELSNLKKKIETFEHIKKRAEGVAHGWMDEQIDIFPFGPSCIFFYVNYIISGQMVFQCSVFLFSM